MWDDPLCFPIAILPVAGLLLGFGSSFTNETTIATYGLQKILGDGTILHALLIIMNKVGSAVFDNLPLIFAVGVAIGMAKKERGSSSFRTDRLFRYERSHQWYACSKMARSQQTDRSQKAFWKVPLLLSAVSSPYRWVCSAVLLSDLVLQLFITASIRSCFQMHFLSWRFQICADHFHDCIYVCGNPDVFRMAGSPERYLCSGRSVTGSGYIGTLIFGIIKRALIPFGLHHVFYMPFWQTAVGGTMEVAGQMVQGGQNIFFAQLADSANVAHFSADATRYFSGEFIFMIFGLPGAALAMYRCAKPEKKKAAGGLLLSAALACMLTGITEPLEFSFLFVAPALFAVQVVLAGAAYMIAHMLNIAVGLTFSGGFLDLFLFGILQGNAKTSWLRIIPVGIIYFILYYVIFTFLIKKFNFKTPGREDDDTETKLYTKADVNAEKKPEKPVKQQEAHPQIR